MNGYCNLIGWQFMVGFFIFVELNILSVKIISFERACWMHCSAMPLGKNGWFVNEFGF